MKTLRIGTRNSTLALEQTHKVASALPINQKIEIIEISTIGDKIQSVPISKIGESAVFAKQLEDALLAGEIDIAVHSCKDLSSQLPKGITLARMLEREDPRDALILPSFASTVLNWKNVHVVGTSSIRREALLRLSHPHITIKNIRGNMQTRLKKLDDVNNTYDAMIVALAGFKRLGWDARVSTILEHHWAIGQGAIAIQCRSEDTHIREMLKNITCWNTWLTVSCERAIMKTLNGGCSIPLGVKTNLVNNTLTIECILFNSKNKHRIAKATRSNIPTDWAMIKEFSEDIASEICPHISEILKDDVLPKITE